MEYKLIAFDMDGTLLNSNKQISKKTQEAIARTVAHNKIVILNTGRNPAELEEFYDILPGVRYLNCISGALVYDLKEKKALYQKSFDEDILKKLLEIAVKEDNFIHFLTEKSFVQKGKVERMKEYHMGIYQEMYERVTIQKDNLVKFYLDNPFPVYKLNLYHQTPESRERTYKRIQEAHLDVEMALAEETSLEITCKNINKGNGLKHLCQVLNLPIEQTIVVGDAGNDVEALKVAGLAVVMDNAIDEIKQYGDVIVSDCDHDGCKEAIEKYLLKE